jgi:hypothetical protein
LTFLRHQKVVEEVFKVNVFVWNLKLKEPSPVRLGVSKGVKKRCKPPALRAGHPGNGCKVVSGFISHKQ